MKKLNYLNKFYFAISFILSSYFIANSASANETIFASAVSKGINVTSCQSCHTGSAGSESKGNLKTNYLAAYTLDKTGLTRLKNLINGCPSGQTINLTTFVCQATVVQPVTVSGSVGYANKGDAATDVYAVTCGAGTSKLSVSVKDLAPIKAGALVSIQAIKGSISSPLSTDVTDGDAGYSPTVVSAGGAGIYNLQINKQLASGAANLGPELYTAQFVCLNSAGAKTTTSAAVIKQQQ